MKVVGRMSDGDPFEMNLMAKEPTLEYRLTWERGGQWIEEEGYRWRIGLRRVPRRMSVAKNRGWKWEKGSKMGLTKSLRTSEVVRSPLCAGSFLVKFAW